MGEEGDPGHVCHTRQDLKWSLKFVGLLDRLEIGKGNPNEKPPFNSCYMLVHTFHGPYTLYNTFRHILETQFT